MTASLATPPARSLWPRLLLLFVLTPLLLNILLYIGAFITGPAFLTDSRLLMAMRENALQLNIIRIAAFAGPTVFVLIRLAVPSAAGISNLPQTTAAAVAAAWIIASILDVILASFTLPLTAVYIVERSGESLMFAALALVATLECGLFALSVYRKNQPLPFESRLDFHRAVRLNHYFAALLLLAAAFAGLNIQWLLKSPARMILPVLLLFVLTFVIQHANSRMGPLLKTLEELRARAEARDTERTALLRSISHQVRTPLSGILGGAEVMLQEGRTVEDRRWLEQIKSSASAVADALDGVLEGSGAGVQYRPLPSRRLSGRVLVVEDHPVTLIVLDRMLQHLGLEPVTAASITQARAKLKSNDYAAALLDLDLPDGDGRDFCMEIRRTNPHLPVLAVTAAALAEERASCLAAGMNDFLAKPVSLENLESKLLEHMRSHETPGIQAVRNTGSTRIH